MGSANDRRFCNVTWSLTGRAHTHNDPCLDYNHCEYMKSWTYSNIIQNVENQNEFWKVYKHCINGWMQKRCNSSALAMELHLFYIQPSRYGVHIMTSGSGNAFHIVDPLCWSTTNQTFDNFFTYQPGQSFQQTADWVPSDLRCLNNHMISL